VNRGSKNGVARGYTRGKKSNNESAREKTGVRGADKKKQ